MGKYIIYHGLLSGVSKNTIKLVAFVGEQIGMQSSQFNVWFPEGKRWNQLSMFVTIYSLVIEIYPLKIKLIRINFWCYNVW